MRFAGESARAWRYLDGEQRVAGIGALLLLVSTFGPFSFVEASVALVALAVLLLLKKRADGRSFHLPFGDGAVIMAAGIWSGLLIVVRVFDRPLGQNLLAIVCAAILALAGLRMRLRRPMDDLSKARQPDDWAEEAGGLDIEFADPAAPVPGPDRDETRARRRPAARSDTAETAALPVSEDETRALPGTEGPRRVRRETAAARRAAESPAPARRPPQPPPPDPDFDVPAPPPAEQPERFRARPADLSDAPPPAPRRDDS